MIKLVSFLVRFWSRIKITGIVDFKYNQITYETVVHTFTSPVTKSVGYMNHAAADDPDCCLDCYENFEVFADFCNFKPYFLSEYFKLHGVYTDSLCQGDILGILKRSIYSDHDIW